MKINSLENICQIRNANKRTKCSNQRDSRTRKMDELEQRIMILEKENNILKRNTITFSENNINCNKKYTNIIHEIFDLFYYSNKSIFGLELIKKLWDPHMLINHGIKGWETYGYDGLILFHKKIHKIFSFLTFNNINIFPPDNICKNTDKETNIVLVVYNVSGIIGDANEILMQYPEVKQLIEKEVYFKFVHSRKIQIQIFSTIYFRHFKIYRLYQSWDHIYFLRQLFQQDFEKVLLYIR